MRTGLTMLWMKWNNAVSSRHRFLQSRENLLLGSRLVRPVCSARTKKSTAETEATDFSSSSSAFSTM